MSYRMTAPNAALAGYPGETVLEAIKIPFFYIDGTGNKPLNYAKAAVNYGWPVLAYLAYRAIKKRK